MIKQTAVTFFIWSLLLLSITIEANPTTQHITFRSPPNTLDELLETINQPAIPILIAYYYIAFLLFHLPPQTETECWIAAWFLHNGGVIHMAMEGLGAGWNLWNAVHDSYQLIDKRFSFSHPDDFNAFLITQLELFVWTPLCFATVIAFFFNLQHRYVLSIITSVCQIVGTIFFVAPPMASSCVDLPPIGEPGCLPEVTPFTMLFHYFGFGINFLWIFIPMYIIVWAWDEVTFNWRKHQ